MPSAPIEDLILRSADIAQRFGITIKALNPCEDPGQHSLSGIVKAGAAKGRESANV